MYLSNSNLEFVRALYFNHPVVHIHTEWVGKNCQCTNICEPTVTKTKDNNMSKRQLLLPRLDISMTNQGYFLPKWVFTPQKETSSHIFKMAIFSKTFGDLISHIIRLYAGRNKVLSECFTIKNSDYTFVFFMKSSLYNLRNSVKDLSFFSKSVALNCKDEEDIRVQPPTS